MIVERIERELAQLQIGGLHAQLLLQASRPVVLYRDVPTGGAELGLPSSIDVVVPVPAGHPAAPIDLAGLPIGSPFLARVRGGQNNQGAVTADGRHWQLASYHPHSNGGGPPYNPQLHGFHTYFDQLVAWLHRLN
jgi:hypothetical protein